MIIRKNDEFINENNELVRVNSKHFDRDYAVSIFEYNEDTEEYDIWDRDTIYTGGEICRLAGTKSITWEDEEE